jgi:hypothetical protein
MFEPSAKEPAMTASASSFASAQSAARAPRTLDELVDLEVAELARLYASAATPRLSDVDGDLEGRVLASPLVGPPVAAALRALGHSKRFPWRGKSFTAGETRGEGINRLFTDRIRRFRFETSIGRSYGGDFDALRLDYDLPENPKPIRLIKDEIRELRPSLWLGQAYFMRRGKPKLWLYFALADRA